jgi:hypothetical protein
MKGWVYVITNKAMDGLVKVGYSTKDPKIRAKDLNNIGSPYPYIVEVDVLVEEPYQIEQQVHRSMRHLSVGKEWFKCTPIEALYQILNVTRGRELLVSDHSFLKGIERLEQLKVNGDIIIKQNEIHQKELARRGKEAEEIKARAEIARAEIVNAAIWEKGLSIFVWIIMGLGILMLLPILIILLIVIIPLLPPYIWIGAMILMAIGIYYTTKEKLKLYWKEIWNQLSEPFSYRR